MPKRALLGIARVDITADSTKFRQEWGKARKKVRAESNIITRSMNAIGLSGKGMGRSVRQGLTSFAGFAGIGVAVAFAVKGMVTQFTKIERGIREISTLMGGLTEQEMEDMRRESQSLAIASGKAIDGLVKARYDIISAGFTDAAESAKVLAASTDLALAGVTEVSLAADIVTTALNAWSLAADQAADVSGKLFAAVRLGKTTVEEIAGGFGRAAAIAGQLGVSLDEVLGALTQLTAAGQSSDEAFTAIRASIVELIKPSKALLGVINSLGFATGQAAIDQVGYAETIRLIGEEAKRTNTPISDLFANVRSMQAVLPLAGTRAKDFAEAIVAIADSSNEAKDAAKIMIDSVDIQFGRFKEAIKAVGADLGKHITDPLAALASFTFKRIEAAGAARIAEGPEAKRKKEIDSLNKSIDDQIDVIQQLRAEVILFEAKQRQSGTDKFAEDIAESERKIINETLSLRKLNAEIDQLIAKRPKKGPRFAAVDPSGVGEGGADDDLAKLEAAKKAAAEVATALEMARKESLELFESLDLSDDEKKANSERIALMIEFTDEFVSLGKDRFELEGELLDEQVDAWEKAGISRTDIDRREAEIRKQIAISEMAAKMQLAQDFLNGVAQIVGTFNQIEAQQAAEKNIQEEDEAQARFEIARRTLRDKNQEEGRLTKVGRAQIEKLEDAHRKNIDSIRESGIADQQKIGKKMQVIQIAQALMSAGLAVVNALATQPFIPLGLASAGLAGGIGVANIAQIRAQKFEKGGVVGDATFFSNDGNLAVAGEAGAEGFFPLGRTASGELGVKNAGGGAGGLTLNFNGPLPEEFITATIRRAEQMAINNDTTLVVTRDFRESSEGLEFGRTPG